MRSTAKPLNATTNFSSARPLLKWAGGKSQLLPHLLPKVPRRYGRYIEPFFGGGALFFALQPERPILADSNPELINLYKTVSENVEAVLSELTRHSNTEKHFYFVRSQNWEELGPIEAAARTVFLNKTCFNGLYRVNRKGNFNVPFGKYKNPTIVDTDNLYHVSQLLRRAAIICGDYKEVLGEFAQPGDFVFLDPPYLPISQYADFKRYTKEQFYEEDHIELSKEVKRLHELGCHTLLTNSNHPLVHEQYSLFSIEAFRTKRHISCNGSNRTGEDVIVRIPPKPQNLLKIVPAPLSLQMAEYPSTRFMGSKSKLLQDIWTIASQFKFETAIDLFSGSGIVGYMFKAQGKQVIANDYMAMSATLSAALVENSSTTLSSGDVAELLEDNKRNDSFVQKTFKGLYFPDEDNHQIDVLRANIGALKDKHKKNLALCALIRACFKRRPRGLFTYTGDRYDDGRRDLRLSLKEHFELAVTAVNRAIFDNGKENHSRHGDALSLRSIEDALVYIDPPYYSPLSDNEYVRRYHFLEGIARDWRGVEIQEHTSTKKFKSYPTPFSSRKGAAEAFDLLFQRFRNNVLLVSYSSNSQPTRDEMVAIMSKHKSHVEVVPINHRYSFGNQNHKVGNNKNKVEEYLFVGY